MEMGHQLPPFLPAVNYQTIATVSNDVLPRQLIGNLGHMSHKRRFGIGEVKEGRDMLLGDDKQMSRCYGIDVAEGDYLFILVQEFTGYLPGYNLTENTVHFSISLC